jgi:hypothetical protein
VYSCSSSGSVSSAERDVTPSVDDAGPGREHGFGPTGLVPDAPPGREAQSLWSISSEWFACDDRIALSTGTKQEARSAESRQFAAFLLLAQLVPRTRFKTLSSGGAG